MEEYGMKATLNSNLPFLGFRTFIIFDDAKYCRGNGHDYSKQKAIISVLRVGSGI